MQMQSEPQSDDICRRVGGRSVQRDVRDEDVVDAALDRLPVMLDFGWSRTFFRGHRVAATSSRLRTMTGSA